jgi:hypothetical protein
LCELLGRGKPSPTERKGEAPRVRDPGGARGLILFTEFRLLVFCLRLRPKQAGSKRLTLQPNQLREGNLLFHSFSRPAVEPGDFQPFLATFGLDHLPRGQALRSLFNRVVFVLDGYNHDPRELQEIPRVRQFCASFGQAWPCWLFACNLEPPNLQALTLSCLFPLMLIRRDGGSLLRVQYAPQELGEFLELNSRE